MHQFSYSVRYNFGNVQGLGEMTLYYRYQLQAETNLRPAIAPRVGLILPSNNPVEDIGEGSLGCELLLPVSNFANDAQLVIGAGVPIVFSNHSVDYGAFFYLSFEPKFAR
jgi:hypothetical protein